MKKFITLLLLNLPLIVIAMQYYGVRIQNSSTQNLYLYTITRSPCLIPNTKIAGIESNELPVKISSTASIQAFSTVSGSCATRSITFGISPGSPIGHKHSTTLITFTSTKSPNNPAIWFNQVSIESASPSNIIHIKDASCVNNWRHNANYPCTKAYPFITQDTDKTINAFIHLQIVFPQ